MDLGFMLGLRRAAETTFHASSQAEAACLLLDCLRAGEPVVVLTGASGLGKTVVLEAALSRLGPEGPRVLRLASPFPLASGLHRRLAALLGLAEPDAATPADLASAIQGLPVADAAPLAVVVDDAQAMPAPLLHYLWLLHGIARQGRPMLQLILVGRDGLWRRLGCERLSGLRRGVSARLAMQPFSAIEAEAFLRYLLKARGCRAESEALAEMLRVGQGVPGRLVTLLDAACAGLPRGGAVSLDRVRLALGRPPVPAGSRPRATPGKSWRLALAWLLTRRPAIAAVAAGAVVLAAVSWQMLSGAPVPQQPRVVAPLIESSLATPAPPPAEAPSPRPPPPAPRLVLSDATAVRVVVHYERDNPRAAARAERAVVLLREAGMKAADPQPVSRRAMRPGVGYFFREDRDGAEAVGRVLADVTGAARVRELPLRTDLPAPGTVDVMVGGRA